MSPIEINHIEWKWRCKVNDAVAMGRDEVRIEWRWYVETKLDARDVCNRLGRHWCFDREDDSFVVIETRRG